ncbi:hypothetical protein E6H27_04740 [Candidatus Bathyarchaeota archaeon]|nr:MAG: hypothetical protein E6H27_04740 [Candidatus Bathyarchaeota archaeon]
MPGESVDHLPLGRITWSNKILSNVPESIFHRRNELGINKANRPVRGDCARSIKTPRNLTSTTIDITPTTKGGLGKLSNHMKMSKTGCILRL